MDNEKRIRELKEEKYQVIFGIEKRTFEAMLAIVENAYKEMRKKGGKKLIWDYPYSLCEPCYYLGDY